MASPEWWMLLLSSELVEPRGKLLFWQLMEIISLINYLHLLGNQLPPAHVMPSGTINWLLSSAWRLWAPDLPIRIKQSGLAVWNTQCLQSRARLLCGTLQMPAASYPPSCPWRAGCVHPSSETSRGWFLPTSQPGTIYVWDCARTLGNAALCSISRPVPNSPACSLKGPDKAFPSRGLTFLEFSSLQRREFRVFSS